MTLAAAAAGALLAVLTAPGASQIEPIPAATPPLAVEYDGDEAGATEPALPAPVQRIGVRHGRRQTIEVVSLEDVEVEVSTARAFLDMRAAAAKDGIELRLESGFRTAAQQRELFLAWRKGHGNKAARPGRSNHQSGRALDISVAGSGVREWLEANAAAFRFKRTVKGEPWHWEHIDIPVARDLTRVAKRWKKNKKHGKAKVVAHAKRPAKRAGAARVSRVATSTK